MRTAGCFRWRCWRGSREEWEKAKGAAKQRNRAKEAPKAAGEKRCWESHSQTANHRQAPAGAASPAPVACHCQCTVPAPPQAAGPGTRPTAPAAQAEEAAQAAGSDKAAAHNGVRGSRPCREDAAERQMQGVAEPGALLLPLLSRFLLALLLRCRCVRCSLCGLPRLPCFLCCFLCCFARCFLW